MAELFGVTSRLLGETQAPGQTTQVVQALRNTRLAEAIACGPSRSLSPSFEPSSRPSACAAAPRSMSIAVGQREGREPQDDARGKRKGSGALAWRSRDTLQCDAAKQSAEVRF